MLLVPNYLKDCVEIKSTGNVTVVLKVICKCGCSEFFILTNELSDDEKKMREYERRFNSWGSIENYIDNATGKRYLVTKNAFGKIKDKIEVGELQELNRTHIVKVRCRKCSKEKVVFDNRYNGYNAFAIRRNMENNVKFNFHELVRLPTEVEIKIVNDLDYEDYVDSCHEQLLNNEFANAFTAITITSIFQGHAKKIFEEEIT